MHNLSCDGYRKRCLHNRAEADRCSRLSSAGHVRDRGRSQTILANFRSDCQHRYFVHRNGTLSQKPIFPNFQPQLNDRPEPRLLRCGTSDGSDIIVGRANICFINHDRNDTFSRVLENCDCDVRTQFSENITMTLQFYSPSSHSRPRTIYIAPTILIVSYIYI